MQILKDNILQNFNNEIYEKDGVISFDHGDKIEIPNEVEYIVPGFIDQHIHGAGGADTMDNSEEAMRTFIESLPKEGTTSVLPTTMTYDLDVVKEVIKIAKATNSKDGANIVGVHLEGPFISKDYIGAQNPEYLIEPVVEEFKKVNEEKYIKVVTYAPELDEDFALTSYLKKNGIIASVGHSGASAELLNDALKKGLNNLTHFHNASSGHHHRDPGVVTFGLMNKDIKAELIVDGIHLNPTVVKAVYNIKGFENIILITDSMRAKGCIDGEYDLGGQKVIKSGNEARLENGVLAGSVLEMNVAIKNMIKFTGCSVEEAFKMASYNVATHLELKTKGNLKEGYDCDITMLDKDFNIVKTIISGETVYEKGE